MANRNQILNDVLSFSVEDLYEAIQVGVITYSELCELPDFSFKRRNQLSVLINGSEDDEWANAVSLNTIEGYQNYCSRYQHGKHFDDAQTTIDNIKRRETEKEKWDALPKWDIDAIKEYVTNHPNSAYVSDANKIIDEYNWKMDDRIWESVDKDDEYALKCFVREHNCNRHIEEAKCLLNEFTSIEDLLETIRHIELDVSFGNPVQEIADVISEYINKSRGNRQRFLEALKKNKNLISVGVVKKLLDYEPNFSEQLEEVVGKDFLRALNSRYSQHTALPTVTTPLEISRVSTEFYFWGIPASGKTCLMASLLSAANNGHAEDVDGMDLDTSCKGYDYLTYLMDFFSGEGNIMRLMPGNGQGSVAEMGFDLIDSKGHRHPITFIDMPGGAFKAMHRENSRSTDNPFKEDLDVVKRLLVDNEHNKNQKVHIFVVEYGAHDKKDGDGLSQKAYLQSATAYIKKQKVFEKKTDMICIVFTKADLVEGGPENFDWEAYLEKHYNGFYTNLEAICKEYEINAGKPVKYWFSIGDVCFRSYCKYNEDAAHKILNFIVDRTWKPNKWKRFFG